MSDESRAWMIHATCRGHDPELFFPRLAETSTLHVAENICRTCPVKTQCADYADQTDSKQGIWGGIHRNLKDYHQPHIREHLPHGTTAAYRRHLRNSEKPCKACRDATSAAKWTQRKAAM